MRALSSCLGAAVLALTALTTPAVAGTVTLFASQTANLDELSPDTPHPGGYLPDHPFGGILLGWLEDFEYNYGLLQFDLSGQTEPVAEATLDVFHIFNVPDSGRTATFGIFQVLSAWDANTVTLNTEPLRAATPIATLSMTIDDYVDGGIYRSFDITPVVNQWITGAAPNYGLAMIRVDQAFPEELWSACCAGHDPRLTLSRPGPPIPEPMTWALMIMGFGLAGAQLRRSGAPATARSSAAYSRSQPGSNG